MFGWGVEFVLYGSDCGGLNLYLFLYSLTLCLLASLIRAKSRKFIMLFVQFIVYTIGIGL